MPVPYQIIPEGSLQRPKQVTYINDNTEIIDDYTAGGGTITSALCVFSSPKGRDGQIITIRNGLEGFMNEYGLGDFDTYGQPLLNAYNIAKAASTGGAMVHCLRVTAPNATYSTATVFARVTATAPVPEQGTPGEDGYKEATPGEYKIGLYAVSTEDEPMYLDEESLKHTYKELSSETDVHLFTIAYRGRGKRGQDIRFRITSDNASDKYNNYKNYNFSIYRNEKFLEQLENFSVSFVPDAVDKKKSIYAEDVINDVANGSNFVYIYVNPEAFNELFEKYLTANPDTGFTVDTFDPLLGIDKFTKSGIIPAWKADTSDITEESGSDTTVIAKYTNISDPLGIALMGGSDGFLDPETEFNSVVVVNDNTKEIVASSVADEYEYKYYTPDGEETTVSRKFKFGDNHNWPTGVDISNVTNVEDVTGVGAGTGYSARKAKHEDVLNALYYAAFSVAEDDYADDDITPEYQQYIALRRIQSRNRFPTTFIPDANFDIRTKKAIIELAHKRTDCVAVLDCGLNILTKKYVIWYYNNYFADDDGKSIFDANSDRIVTIEAYAGKMKDPYSKRTVTVTSTAWFVPEYLIHINNWNGKHKPMAGNTFGVIDGDFAFKTGTVYPIFDTDIDADILDELADMHVNVAVYNPNQQVARHTQNTCQTKWTALTELNNVLILLDIKRDCERLCSTYEYEFAEPEDLARFNADISSLLTKYSAAQVRRISGYFDHNQWERDRGILHLYVELVHRDLVKTCIIEIDVNRDVEED